jgi:hypothetical protein
MRKEFRITDMTDDLFPLLAPEAGGACHGRGLRQGKAKDSRSTVSYRARVTSNDPGRHMQHSLPSALLRKSSDDTRAQQPQGGRVVIQSALSIMLALLGAHPLHSPFNTGMPSSCPDSPTLPPGPCPANLPSLVSTIVNARPPEP